MRRMWSKKQVEEFAKNKIETLPELNLDGELNVGGDLHVNVGSKVYAFENIVDSEGHVRYIEGALTTPTISGITFTYAKWSLSGTHLMLVLAGNIANGTSYSTTTFGEVALDSWIMDKIYPIVGTVVIPTSIPMFADDYSSQEQGVNLNKEGNVLSLRFASNTLTANRTFRIQFDLLIDNE